jgi:hypothetical protein
MLLRRLRTLSAPWRWSALALAGASFLFACAQAPAPPKKAPPAFDPGDDSNFYGADMLPEDPLPQTINADSGAFAPERPSPNKPARRDAGIVDPDAGPEVDCDSPIAAGDLAIVEIMIASKSGSNDAAEWVEVRSTRDCWLPVKGVSVESPRGTSASNVATISESFSLPPHGTFVVAGSADPAVNGNLPGKLFAWAATDVLKNDGDTIIVKKGSLTIDTITYPSLSFTSGRSIAFPDDCPGANRSDWNRWSQSFDEYAPGLKGTPNAPNLDVLCF